MGEIWVRYEWDVSVIWVLCFVILGDELYEWEDDEDGGENGGEDGDVDDGDGEEGDVEDEGDEHDEVYKEDENEDELDEERMTKNVWQVDNVDYDEVEMMLMLIWSLCWYDFF